MSKSWKSQASNAITSIVSANRGAHAHKYPRDRDFRPGCGGRELCRGGAQLLDRSCGGQPGDQGLGRGPVYLAVHAIDARIEVNDRRRAFLSRWCPATAKLRTNDPQIPRRYGIAWAAQDRHGALPFPANAVA